MLIVNPNFAIDRTIPLAVAVASGSCEQPVAGAVDFSRVRELAATLGAGAL